MYTHTYMTCKSVHVYTYIHDIHTHTYMTYTLLIRLSPWDVIGGDRYPHFLTSSLPHFFTSSLFHFRTHFFGSTQIWSNKFPLPRAHQMVLNSTQRHVIREPCTSNAITGAYVLGWWHFLFLSFLSSGTRFLSIFSGLYPRPPRLYKGVIVSGVASRQCDVCIQYTCIPT